MNKPSPTLLIQRESTSNVFPHLLIISGGGLMFFDLAYTKIGGLVVMAAGLFTLFAKTGYEIDVANQRYRDYTKVGFIRFGGWRPLPEIEYIAIVRVKLSQLAFRPSEVTFRQSSDKFTVAFQVNLILKKDAPVKIIKLYNGELENAMNYTMQLSKAFQKPIYDCTTSEKKWLNINDTI